jgi:hypothetical protein
MPRRFVIAQAPNPPMIVAVSAGVVARLSDGEVARAAGVISDAALLVWAYEEIVDGANWFRRLIGVGGVLVALRSGAMR